MTLVDVLEAIVGELPTLEERLKPEAIKRNDGSWLVDGQFDHCKLLCLIEGVETEEFNGKIKQSIASFVSSRLRKGVCEGDVLGSSDGLHYEILDLDGERIDKVLVTRAEAKR